MHELHLPKPENHLWERIIEHSFDGEIHTIGPYSQKDIKSIFDKQKKAISIANRKPKILVVDDEPHIVTLLKVNLRDEYEVMDAYCGEEAIKIAEKEQPDLITMDVMMPAMDGMEVVQILKTNERTKHIPIVMISAKTQTEDKMQAIGVGADDYVTKPFTKATLKETIKNNLYFD